MIRTKEKYMCIVEDCYSTARFGYKNIFNEVDNTNLQYNPCKYSTLRHLYNEGFVLVEKCNVHKENGMINLIDNDVCKSCFLKKINKNKNKNKNNNNKYNNMCIECHNKINNDEINYKNKEISVKKYLIDSIPEYNFINDKRIKFSIELPYRPDFQLEINNKLIIIEVDETQHTKYNTDEEEKRNILIKNACEINNKKIAIIRFNPDNYKKDGQVITSPWKKNKIQNEDEWMNRLNALKETILFKININDYNYNVTKLFYDE
jgi:hypothetical protein